MEVFRLICAHDWIRTSTSFRTPPPQDGKSTNFSTWANTGCKCKEIFQILRSAKIEINNKSYQLNDDNLFLKPILYLTYNVVAVRFYHANSKEMHNGVIQAPTNLDLLSGL